MAKSATMSVGMSKSALIRETRKENPELGPTAVANLIMERHGVKVSPAAVSTITSQDKNRGGEKVARPGRPVTVKNKTVENKGAIGNGMSIDLLLQVKKLADEVGGVENAKKALDALSQILA